MKEDNKKQKKKSQSKTAWLVTVFVASLLVSASFSFLSQKLLGGGSMFAGFVVLLAIIAIGMLFDMLGVSVTAADEKPFHSMASRKVPGATEAIRLLRNAGKVSSICCDIVGDICGVISGAAAALIAVEAFTKLQSLPLTLLQLLLSALVASLTITGKAYCKYIALDNSTGIVHGAAKVIHFFKTIFHKKHQSNHL